MKTTYPCEHAEFVKQSAHLNALVALKNKRQVRIDEIVSAGNPADSPSERRRRRALKLVETGEFAPLEPQSTRTQELTTAYREKAEAEDAIHEQTGRVNQLQGRISKDVCAEVRSQYSARVAKNAEALVAAVKAGAEETAFRESLEGKGVMLGTLDLCPLPLLGSPKDTHSPVCHYIREAVAAGHMTGREKFLEGIEWQYK